MKRVGIFAGTFDPVHEGHLQFAKQAQEQCRLDKVFFLIEPRPRRKQGVRSLEHRVNMVRLAIEAEPTFGLIRLEQARFSVAETLPLLTNRFKGAELDLLLGDDVLAHLAEWPHVEELLAAVRFIVGVRADKAGVEEHIRAIEKARGLSFDYTTFVPSLSGTSSSSVRTVLRRGQTPSAVNPKVLAYIRRHKLYAPVSAAS